MCRCLLRLRCSHSSSRSTRILASSQKFIARLIHLVARVFLFRTFCIFCATFLIRCIVYVAFTLVQRLLLLPSQEFLPPAPSAQFGTRNCMSPVMGVSLSAKRSLHATRLLYAHLFSECIFCCIQCCFIIELVERRVCSVCVCLSRGCVCAAVVCEVCLTGAS